MTFFPAPRFWLRLTFAGSLALSSFAHGSDTIHLWENPAGGQFSDTTNWSLQTDLDATSTARFGIGGTFTVTLPTDITIRTLQVNQGDGTEITLDLNGHTLKASSEDAEDASLQIRSDDEASRTLRLVNGILDVQTIRFGQGGSEVVPATLIIAEGGVLRQRNDTRIPNTGKRKARVHIMPGGKLESFFLLELSRGEGAYGEFLVEGPNALADFQPSGSSVNTPIYVGFGGYGKLAALAGGKIRGAGILELGRNSPDSEGIVEAQGPGSEIECQSIYIGGRSSGGGTQAGKGRLQVSDGGLVQVERSLHVFESGEVQVAGGQINIGGNARFNENATLRITLADIESLPLFISGTATIQDAKLVIEIPQEFSGKPGDTFSLLGYDKAYQGYFSALPNGAELEVNGYHFTIAYGTGNQDRITLELKSSL